MQIVIDIPEEEYNIAKFGQYGNINTEIVRAAIKNGTPLPKGHGALIDFDELCESYWDGNYMEIHRNDLADIKPIIEADTEE